jgi:D-glycero-D-manno-heptose 1,7-bisphosphate phosphatase
MCAAVFLDKDGTLVKDISYNVDINEIKLAPYALLSLKRLSKEGFKFVIITNQSGVALGFFKEEELKKVKRYFADLFKDHGLDLLGFYYCPHHPQGKISRYTRACECRKPLPGMIQQAIEDHAIDVSQSWLIGDILDDIECGRRAECRTILINNGNETQWVRNPLREPHAVVKNLKEAAEHILKVKEYDKQLETV